MANQKVSKAVLKERIKKLEAAAVKYGGIVKACKKLKVAHSSYYFWRRCLER